MFASSLMESCLFCKSEQRTLVPPGSCRAVGSLPAAPAVGCPEKEGGSKRPAWFSSGNAFPPTDCIGANAADRRGRSDLGLQELPQFTWPLQAFTSQSSVPEPPQPSAPASSDGCQGQPGDSQAGRRHCLSRLKESHFPVGPGMGCPGSAVPQPRAAGGLHHQSAGSGEGVGNSTKPHPGFHTLLSLRMRGLAGITESMDMSLSKLRELVTGRPEALQSMASQRVGHD